MRQARLLALSLLAGEAPAQTEMVHGWGKHGDTNSIEGMRCWSGHSLLMLPAMNFCCLAAQL